MKRISTGSPQDLLKDLHKISPGPLQELLTRTYIYTYYIYIYILLLLLLLILLLLLLLLLFHITLFIIITIFTTIIITILIIIIVTFIITIILVLLLDHPLLPQLRHSQNFFTTGLVSHDNGYPSLTCKAYNGRVFLVFLTTCLGAFLNQIGDDQEVTLAFSTSKPICVRFDRIERYGRYLTIRKPGICMMH